MTADYEKLGAFYLGRGYDVGGGQLLDDLVLYDSKDLVTHGVCFGMTGGGKTGLCACLLEEALIDGIPVIATEVALSLLGRFRGLPHAVFMKAGAQQDRHPARILGGL